jgi:hypothetical protein
MACLSGASGHAARHSTRKLSVGLGPPPSGLKRRAEDGGVSCRVYGVGCRV